MLQSPFLRGLLVTLACAFILAHDFAVGGGVPREADPTVHEPTPAAPASRPPLPLTVNVGQWHADTVAVARLGPVTTYLHRNGWTTARRDDSASSDRHEQSECRQGLWTDERYAVSKFTFVDANPQARVEPEHLLATSVSHGRVGGHEAWHTAIPTCTGARYPELIPGVDLDVQTDAASLTWQLAHATASDPDRVRVFVQGAQRLRVTPRGYLEVRTPAGTVCYGPPSATRAGRSLRCRYVLHGSFTFGFQVRDGGERQPGPTLVRFTLCGDATGGDETSLALQAWDDPCWPRALDPTGQWVVAGVACSADCPPLPASPDDLVPLPVEAFVACLSEANRSTRRLTSVAYLQAAPTIAFEQVTIDGLGRAVFAGRPDPTAAEPTTLVCLAPHHAGAEAVTFMHPALAH